MKIDRIDLTPAEAAWFSRNVLAMLKNLEAAAEYKDPEIIKRTTYKVLNSLRTAAEEAGAVAAALGEDQPNFMVEVTAGKKQRQIIGDLVTSAHKTLTERTIPEYERRGEGYEEYLLKAKTKAQFLRNLGRKFK